MEDTYNTLAEAERAAYLLSQRLTKQVEKTIPLDAAIALSATARLVKEEVGNDGKEPTPEEDDAIRDRIAAKRSKFLLELAEVELDENLAAISQRRAALVSPAPAQQARQQPKVTKAYEGDGGEEERLHKVLMAEIAKRRKNKEE